MTGKGGSTLRSRSITAAKWNMAGSIFKSMLQLVVGVALARILGPEVFGVIAVAWIIISAGSLISDLGFSAALVQKSELLDGDVEAVYTAQISVGIILAACTALWSEMLAGFFNVRQSSDIIAAVGLYFAIRSLGQTSAALLQRNLKFGVLQTANLLSQLGYAATGIALAYSGAGAWSLIVAQLTQASIYSAAVVSASKDRIRIRLFKSDRTILRFGGPVLAANIINWAISNIDSIMIARAASTASLGFYNRALALVLAPVSAITAGFQPVLFASCSRAHGNRQQIKLAYLASNGAVGLICFPPFLLAAAIPETIIAAVYGEEWLPAAPLLAPLSIAMMLHATLGLAGPVLMALDEVRKEVVAQLATLAIMLPLLLTAAAFSVEAIAWAVVAGYSVRFAFLVLFLKKAIQFRLFELLKVMIYPLILGTVTYLSSLALERAITAAPTVKFIAITIGSVMVWAAFFALLSQRLLLASLAGDVSMLQWLPLRLRRWIRL